ncbi:hypothetical protein N7537_010941 [Penicillium hordei]|uniref:Uncharacterized protein n=1 Tax=Penicillium hordei TaxID=40994 RepID=A0AAD6DKT9_9EURO|nr:uncharacterized protein N7537_010941 [Penicillium hordei]KAJ5588263.1 hypothetical protein N7537_010941 [Penicillium hordei]
MKSRIALAVPLIRKCGKLPCGDPDENWTALAGTAPIVPEINTANTPAYAAAASYLSTPPALVKSAILRAKTNVYATTKPNFVVGSLTM